MGKNDFIPGVQVKVKKLHPDATLPKYAHYGTDMGADLTSVSFKYDYEKDRYIYHTGLAFEIPQGFGMLILPRSSNTKTECYLPNSCGVIDSCYRGEVMFIYKLRTSRNELFPGESISKEYLISKMEELAPYKVGDRLGQAIILSYPVINYIEVEELEESERGSGGFGSSGK